MKSQRFETLQRMHAAKSNLNYLLEVFGDDLARREGYRDINGIEAIHLYLVNKHHWLPRDVRAMSYDDLQFALHTEMQGWTPPPDAR